MNSESAKEVPARPRIGIVDDDARLCRATERLCEAFGFDATSFYSAEGFLKSDDTDSIDCLVLDLQLPGMSGLELQELLLTRKQTTPVIMTSASRDHQAREQAIGNGAVAFLQKPMDCAQLVEMIQFALNLDES